MNNKLLFATSFLAFIIFHTNLIFSSATSAPPAVRDVRGRELRGGIGYAITYTILPAITSSPDLAGVFLSKDCPPQVIQDNVQESAEFKNGTPLLITGLDLKKSIIRTSSDVNIRFFGDNNCSSSLVWKLQDMDPLTGNYYVGVGGVIGNPGPQTVNNWFKIEKTKVGYKLRFCPSVCKTCKVMCKDIGIVKDQNGKRRLALSDIPFEVIFG
ncbi:OLC1v1013946C1 [Oldenlandia corymbosa var. corymbosa]|uniref:OLC1v1013946C1 n=1 Tax=Oldenlandia corymbosa var. corymbosa TaxID=529605 RepID=A0AAV1DZJ5_OLDCO|nr:OLC1v1013946C1 [Oldenlandia corymbosa var. corymbosa]